MIDPLSTLSAPPPRYLLESDSSDEEGQGMYATAPKPPKIRTSTSIAVQWLDGAVPVASVVVGVGQAGKYLARRANARMASLAIDVNGSVVGNGFVLSDSGLLVVLADQGEKEAFGVVEKLVDCVKAKDWTIVSSYVPALYIPAASEVVASDPPVRCLAVGTSKNADVKGYDAPNYVTGVAGAFLSQAAHPAFALDKVTLFLLPLPLSRLAPTAIAAVLASLPPALATPLSRAAVWNDADDEPYAGLGMGARRAPRQVVTTAADLGGMYM